MGKATKSDSKGDKAAKAEGKQKGPKPASMATVLRPVCIGAGVLAVLGAALPKVL